MPAVDLPDLDIAYLSERDIDYEVTVESGMTCVVMPQWRLPTGLDREASDLLVRLSPGYPDVQPDMWWFSPPVHLADGSSLPNTDAVGTHLGRRWQRWSRHFNNGQWQSGVDGLESYLALIRKDIERGIPESFR